MEGQYTDKLYQCILVYALHVRLYYLLNLPVGLLYLGGDEYAHGGHGKPVIRTKRVRKKKPVEIHRRRRAYQRIPTHYSHSNGYLVYGLTRRADGTIPHSLSRSVMR